MRSAYRFTHHVVVPHDRAQVHDLLADLERYSLWWPQIRAVAKVDDDHAIVVCRSALPYDMELGLTARRRDPGLLEVGIDGPIEGFARWTLTEEDDTTRLDYVQEVDAVGRLALASYLLKPLLRWNHAVMMRGFDAGVQQALSEGPGGRNSARSA